MTKQLTHVAGTFIVQADAAFLNGAGLGDGEDRNVTVPKTFWNGNRQVPYVSSQAWKRWLRTTFIQETGWPSSEPKAIGWNPKGNVNKIAGELNPVEIPEDDIFGYMRAEEGQGKRTSEEEGDEESEDAEAAPTKKAKSLIRAAPFMASVLFPIPLSIGIGKDEGFVHLTKYDPQSLAEAEVGRYLSAIDKAPKKKQNAWKKLEEVDPELYKTAKGLADKNELEELRKTLSAKAGDKEVKFIENACSPLPYSTKFYSSSLQGIFCLNYSRLGVYWNLGDRIELEEAKVKKLVEGGKIKEVTKEERYKDLTENGKIGKVYEVTNKVEPAVKERASALFKSLSVLRGGAKQAQFGTDVSPKVMILAGLTCGNPIFNHLFVDSTEGPELRTATLKEIVKDYADRIVTPVIIGVRTGYLKNENEKEVKEMNKTKIVIRGDKPDKKEVEFLVMTPLEAAQKIGELLL